METVVLIRPKWKDEKVNHVFRRFNYFMDYMYWAMGSIKNFLRTRMSVVELKGNQVTKENVEETIRYYRPKLVIIGTHGFKNALVGNYESELICSEGKKCTNPNPDILRDTITVALACNSAKNLGKEVINSGGKAYIGYKDILLIPLVRSPFSEIFSWDEAWVNIIIRGIEILMNGGTARESVEETKKAYQQWIDYYRENRDPYGIWKIIIVAFMINMDHLVLYGDPEARLSSNLEQIKPAKISGLIRGSDGGKLIDATVKIGRTTIEAKNGKFEVINMNPNTYSIAVYAKNYKPFKDKLNIEHGTYQIEIELER